MDYAKQQKKPEDEKQEWEDNPPSARSQGYAEPQLKLGYSYLIEEERPNHSLRIFAKHISETDFSGLCITRMLPEHVKQGYNMKKASIVWLTETSVESISTIPPKPEQLFTMIRNMVGKTKKSIILFDGVEYLISYNNFNLVLHFIQSLRDYLITNNSILILSINPFALEEKELKLIEKEMDYIEVVDIRQKEAEKLLSEILHLKEPR